MYKLLFSLLALSLLWSPVSGQGDLNSPVPLDPAIRTGVLENGMTYYIRHNQEPKERASFYIIQNVGAILEEDSQNGLAHFLEHMAFNGTKHFPGKGIISSLERHGVAFGRNINAYTAQDETVYNISNVPVAPKGLLDTCLLVLHDWSNYLLLEEEEIDAERGVISEEWRTRRDAGFRIRNQMTPVVTNGSKYGERDVIGDLDVIKEFEYQTLRNFYHDWYRTDLQAVAIVGDFDVDEMEAKVKELFSKIPAVENPKERYNVEIEPKAETDYVLATDKEAGQSSIALYIRHPEVKAEDKTHETLRTSYMKSLASSMISARMQELLQNGTPPFINGGMGFSGYNRTTQLFYLSATAKENDEANAFKTILTEAERIKRHGFTEGELERAKTTMLLGYENYYKSREKINHDSYCKEFKDLYLTNSPMPGIEYEYNFAKNTIPGITAKEVSQLFFKYFSKENRVIVITGPDKQGINHLSKEESLAVIEEVSQTYDIAPYVDAVVSSSLVEKLGIEGKVIAEKELPEFDAVEWTLSNNTKVVYRFADYNKNSVSLSSYSKGGSSLYEVNDLATLGVMSSFMSNFGIGEFSATDLRKALTGKSAKVNFAVGELSENIGGSCRPEDFETMMQLAYLRFEQPRFDKEAYDAYMQRNLAYVANMGNDPKKAMGDSVSLIRSNYHERTLLFGEEFLQAVSFERMQKIYQERFNDASDFVFFIVGDIEKEVAKELSAKYLGAISSKEGSENWVDNKVSNPEGNTKKQIALELTEPKATVKIYYDNEIDYTPENRIAFSFIKSILTLRYTEEIREKEGGTYGVGVGAGLGHYPTAEGTVSIGFDCDPERSGDLIPLVYREIEKLMKEGASDEDIEKTRSNLLKGRVESKENNGYWMSMIKSYYIHGVNNNLPENYEQIVENMDSKQIQKIAKQFFESADKMELIFVPK
ncbi:M16 family metallopeptidase [Carboxylicivirga sp. N1Y90]|uniref:M16 family metallopeptidase n=1 Tax=Carboxylicivirga fragile TaxID=3417571 RepID=UPI003D353200|nr:insulinase family protein [Marinilabiliaceae bacterium N1Y90]